MDASFYAPSLVLPILIPYPHAGPRMPPGHTEAISTTRAHPRQPRRLKIGRIRTMCCGRGAAAGGSPKEGESPQLPGLEGPNGRVVRQGTAERLYGSSLAQLFPLTAPLLFLHLPADHEYCG